MDLTLGYALQTKHLNSLLLQVGGHQVRQIRKTPMVPGFLEHPCDPPGHAVQVWQMRNTARRRKREKKQKNNRNVPHRRKFNAAAQAFPVVKSKVPFKTAGCTTRLRLHISEKYTNVCISTTNNVYSRWPQYKLHSIYD